MADLYLLQCTPSVLLRQEHIYCVFSSITPNSHRFKFFLALTAMTVSTATPKLFQPVKVGNMQLAHRIVFAPSTRFRNDKNHVPLPIVKEYYRQRASVPGSFIIYEASVVAPKAAGFGNAAAIWSDEQVAAMKEVRASPALRATTSPQ